MRFAQQSHGEIHAFACKAEPSLQSNPNVTQIILNNEPYMTNPYHHDYQMYGRLGEMTMLKAINYGQVWSEDRRIIIKKDREYISYKENDYALRIGIGRRNNPHMIFVDCDDIEGWFPLHHNEPMTKDKVKIALKRIEEALKLWGDSYQLVNKPVDYDLRPVSCITTKIGHLP